MRPRHNGHSPPAEFTTNVDQFILLHTEQQVEKNKVLYINIKLICLRVNGGKLQLKAIANTFIYPCITILLVPLRY